MMMNGSSCGDMGWPMMIGGGLFMLLFWGLIIWLVIYLIRNLSQNSTTNNSDKAVDLLKQRYSRGEISTEEYRERLYELTDKTN